MKITSTKKNGCLFLKIEGRLDAAWSEHFYNAVAAGIREGMHDVRIDAGKLEYLSSAGIRVFMRALRELKTVNGSFAIVRASNFVIQTLSMSGFDSLLALETGPEMEETESKPSESATLAPSSSLPERAGIVREIFEFDPEASMEVREAGSWIPWHAVDPEKSPKLTLGRDSIALGTGAPGADFNEAKGRMGDFAAAAGCVTWQPGNGNEPPDYIVQEGRLVPELVCANALLATGGISHLLRFRPSEKDGKLFSIGSIIEDVSTIAKSPCVVFVALAEIDGLVGMSTNRSPGLIEPGREPNGYPDVREWTSFCGERLYEGLQAFIVGIADLAEETNRPMLPHLPSSKTLAHVHAAAFPFRALPNGKILMADSVTQVFSGAGPVGMLHLVRDGRPTLGLGESSFRRGAVWFSPAKFISTEEASK